MNQMIHCFTEDIGSKIQPEHSENMFNKISENIKFVTALLKKL